MALMTHTCLFPLRAFYFFRRIAFWEGILTMTPKPKEPASQALQSNHLHRDIGLVERESAPSPFRYWPPV